MRFKRQSGCNVSGRSAAFSSNAPGRAAASRAVTRAAVQCYATEGRYPASIDYLVERYGLSVDRARYIVHYDRFAENLMPDIRVLPMTFEEDDIPAEEGWG